MWARCEADGSLILLSRGHLRLQQISSASTCSTCLCRHVIWISVRDIQIKRCYNTQNTPTDCVWDWYSRLLVLAIRKNESIVSLVTLPGDVNPFSVLTSDVTVSCNRIGSFSLLRPEKNPPVVVSPGAERHWRTGGWNSSNMGGKNHHHTWTIVTFSSSYFIELIRLTWPLWKVVELSHLQHEVTRIFLLFVLTVTESAHVLISSYTYSMSCINTVIL